MHPYRLRIVAILFALYGLTFNLTAQEIPELGFADSFGGSEDDATLGIARDTNYVYLVGITRSTNFPVTPGAYQMGYGGDTDPQGGGDIFVMKRDATTREVVWATYLGGDETDFGTGIVVDRDGSVLVSGWTRSADFPVTPDALQTNLAGPSDGIVAKFDADGNLLYSSYIGGSEDDQFAGISILAGTFQSFFAVAGFSASTNFPVTSTAGFEDTTLNGGADAVVILLNADCTLRWATYLGGIGNDVALAVDIGGNNVVAAGYTESVNFPRGPFESHQGGQDAFFAVLDFSDARAQGRIVGGASNDVANAIIRVDDDNYFIAGATSSDDFQTTDPEDLGLSAAYAGGDRDGFIVRYDAGFSRRISGYYGGSGDDSIRFLANDGISFLHAGGETTSTNFPVIEPFQSSYGGDPFDGFLSRFVLTYNGFTRAITGTPDFASYFGESDNEAVTSGVVAPDGTAPRTFGFGFVTASADEPSTQSTGNVEISSSHSFSQSSGEPSAQGDDEDDEDAGYGEYRPRGAPPTPDVVLTLKILEPSPGPVLRGQSIEFEIKVGNLENPTADNVVVAAPLSGLTNQLVLSATKNGQDISGNLQVNQSGSILFIGGIGSMESDATVVIVLRATVLEPDPENPGQVIVTATASTTTTEDIIANNTGTASIAFAEPTPVIAIFPAPLEFGQLNTGASTTLSLTISNAGTAGFSVTGLSISPSPSPFSITAAPDRPFSLGPGQTATVEVTYQPEIGAAGQTQATLNIFGTAGQNAEVLLSGTAIASPRIGVNPSALDFGNVLVGASASVTLTVTNAGDADLQIGEILFTGDNKGDFSVTRSNGLPAQFFSLAPGESETLTVDVTPSGPGALGALMEVPSNDPDLPTFFVELAATGIDAPDLEVTIPKASIGPLQVAMDGRGLPGLFTTIQLANRGTLDATNILLTITRQGLEQNSSAPDIAFTATSSDVTYFVFEIIPVLGPGQSTNILFFDDITPPDQSHLLLLTADGFADGDVNPANNTAALVQPFLLLRTEASPENPAETCILFQSFTGYEFIVYSADNVNGSYTEVARTEGQDNRVERICVPRGSSPRKFFRVEIKPLTI